MLTGDLEERVILDVTNDVFFTLRKIPCKFSVDILLGIVSRIGAQEWGFLEDVQGS